MKTMKLIYPLAFVLAASLIATGCKHKPTGITPLPGQGNMVGEQGPAYIRLERLGRLGKPVVLGGPSDHLNGPWNGGR